MLRIAERSGLKQDRGQAVEPGSTSSSPLPKREKNRFTVSGGSKTDAHYSWMVPPALKQEIKQPRPDEGEKQKSNVMRRIVSALPGVTEKLSHGEPHSSSRGVRNVLEYHHNDGHVAVVIPAAIGIQRC